MVAESARVDALKRALSEMGQVAVALSGGVDSTFLMAMASQVLGQDHVVALTVRSPLQTDDEIASAQEVASAWGVRHIVQDFDELAIDEVAHNHPERCYYCKRARFVALRAAVSALGSGYTLVHGENADDRNDYRPGARAARELQVRAPLAEAGLTKSDIRALSREMGLATWDRPSAPCLATRFAFGRDLDRDGLVRVARAEAAVRAILGLSDCRVRDHLPMARIELAAADMARAVLPETRQALVQALQDVGYQIVTLDLGGYKMGNMNDTFR